MYFIASKTDEDFIDHADQSAQGPTRMQAAPVQNIVAPATDTTKHLALNWLEGHHAIMGFWLDRLVSENGDIMLIDTLHRQCAWLASMTDRLSRSE